MPGERSLVIILLDDNKEGKLNLEIDHQQFGFMEISIDEEILTVSHTEVIPEGQGKGYAGKLFNALVAYARKEHLKIRPDW